MNMVGRALYVVTLAVGLCSSAAHSMDITYPANADGDTRLEYPLALLELALTKAGVDYTLVPKERPGSNTRVAVLMEQEGTFDVAFFGTRPDLEERLRPIRFPIHRGLLGFRVAITHKDNLAKLDEVNTPEEFLELSVCQGLGWSDTAILQEAGFFVVTGDYHNLFKVVNARRCDLYTRALFEAYGEVDQRQSELPDLVVDDSILIRYRLASFIFVNPAKEELAQAIERGLEVAMQDGSFRRLFESATVHVEARKRANVSARHCIDIPNSLLSPETAAIPDDYWGGFDFGDAEDGAGPCDIVGSVSPS